MFPWVKIPSPPMVQISHPWTMGENAWTGFVWFQPGITKTRPQIPETCYLWRKKAPARKPGHMDSCLYAPKSIQIHPQPFRFSHPWFMGENSLEPIFTHALSLSLYQEFTSAFKVWLRVPDGGRKPNKKDGAGWLAGWPAGHRPTIYHMCMVSHVFYCILYIV